MRILFIAPSYKPYLGGVERVLEQISQRLVNNDKIADVGLLTTKFDFNKHPPKLRRDLPDYEIIDGLKVYRRRFFLKKLPLFYHLPAGIFTPLNDVFKDFRPDVIHFLFSEWYGANYFIYRQSRDCAHIFTYFYHPFPGWQSLPMRLLNRRLCDRVDYVHVVSDQAEKHVKNDFGLPAARIKQLPLGVAEHKPIIAKSVKNGEALTILSVGRLSWSKGQLELVKIFARQYQDFNRPVRLVLVGGDGGMRAIIEDFIKDNSLEQVVEMTGFVDQIKLEELYRQADIFCLLSQVEAYGLAFLEAMSFGLPVIAYDLAAVHQVLTEGAVLVDPKDATQTEAALRQLVTNDKLRLKLSRAAGDLFTRQPTWDEVADELILLYQQALSNNRN